MHSDPLRNDLDWDTFAGRGDPEQRYRLYIVCAGETKHTLLTTCATEEAVGVMLCQLGRDGQLKDCAHGCLDTMPEEGQPAWLWKPWRAMPKEVSHAGRVLRASQTQ